jgi:hypothetical protein
MPGRKSLEYDDTYWLVSKYATPFHPLEKVMIPYYHWLVVSNMTGLFSISYMGCHPSQLTFTPSFFRGVAKKTNQIALLIIINHIITTY